MAELDQIDTKILPLSSAKPGELAAVQQYCLVTDEVTGVLMLHMHMQDMDKHTALCDTLFDADENVVWYRAYIVTEILKSTRSSFF
ncbi:hypothetical protein [Thalassospira lohafexi]|uniref:hypothetical protein n=1 Tax=Thalassospira lohafexi TaxID=744227 RepID=UPI001980D863|nr:hypothetical protein [Thalassospira lohafexi]